MNHLNSQVHTWRRGLPWRPSPKGLVAVLAAASLTAAAMAGCTSKSDTESSESSSASATSAASGSTTTSAAGAQSADAAPLLSGASATMAATTSVHVDLAVTDIDKLAFQSVNADVTSGTQGGDQQGAEAVGEASIRPGQNMPFVEKSFVVVDKMLYTKDDEGNYTLVGPAEKIYDPGIVLNPDMGLAKVISEIKDAKVESTGPETVNGVQVVKITGTIAGNVIDPVVPRLGKDADDNDVPSLPITLWVQYTEPGEAPSTSADRPEANGSNLVKMVIKKDEGQVEISLSKWNEPVEIPNPTG